MEKQTQRSTCLLTPKFVAHVLYVVGGNLTASFSLQKICWVPHRVVSLLKLVDQIMFGDAESFRPARKTLAPLRQTDRFTSKYSGPHRMFTDPWPKR